MIKNKFVGFLFFCLFCVPGVCCYFLRCLREREVKNTMRWAQRERERENEIEKQNNNKNKENTREGQEQNHSWEHILKGMQRFHAQSILPTLLDII